MSVLDLLWSTPYGEPCYNFVMNEEDAKAYLSRWKVIERLQQEESRQTTIRDRWKQLNAIRRRAVRLGIARSTDDGEMEVFSRWSLIREKHGTS